MIDYYMPSPDGSDDCKVFMKERYTKEYPKVKGSLRTYTISQNIHYLNALMRHITAAKNFYQNQLQDVFNVNKVEMIDFGRKGSIKMMQKENASIPEIGNYTKKDPELDDIAKKMVESIRKIPKSY
jgi:hypothetical protein